MNDIADQLRKRADMWERIGNNHPAYRDGVLLARLREAADEIERLRAALKPFADAIIQAEQFANTTTARLRDSRNAVMLIDFDNARHALEGK